MVLRELHDEFYAKLHSADYYMSITIEESKIFKMNSKPNKPPFS
ncbi:unnamed protein product [Strongylus vulgaris]|uniref:Uncharacterized protein n=1 Tax=Strongylus vulgaris TaxID=40348 RepID=A0A3P7I7Y6_STRVU|nr:unnamed protein product [Strongylus vulgaris]